jgi:hypothetical protein
MERYLFPSNEKKDIESLFSKQLTNVSYLYKNDLKYNGDLLYALIPDGNRFYCCFLKYKNKQFCVFLNGKTKLLIFGFRIHKLLLSLKNPIVFFGTKCKFLKRQMFCCEHILAESEFVSSIEKRLTLLKIYLKMISHLGSQDTIFFSCPIFETNSETITHMLTKRLVPYKTKFVEVHINFKKEKEKEKINSKICLLGYRKFMEKVKGRETRAFYVVSDKKLPDTYYLYNKWDDRDYVDMLLIPDYKTSLYMNQLFGNKKSTLESLEESDDEKEEEKDEKEKKKILVECYLIESKKRWTPIL